MYIFECRSWRSPEEGVRSLRTGVTVSCELPTVKELNSDPLQEQNIPWTADQSPDSLHPFSILLKKSTLNTQNKTTGSSPLCFPSSVFPRKLLSDGSQHVLFLKHQDLHSQCFWSLHWIWGFKNKAQGWCPGILLGPLLGTYGANFSLLNSTLDPHQVPLGSVWAKKLARHAEQGFCHHRLRAIANVFSLLEPVCWWAMCSFPKKDIGVSAY